MIFNCISYFSISGGVPNITGTYAATALTNGTPVTSGALYAYSSKSTSQGQSGSSPGIGFDASRSSTLYKNNFNTVQPTSLGIRVKTRAK